MDQARLLIAIVLSLVVFLAWHFFWPQEDQQQAPKKVEAPAATKEQPVQEKEKPYTEKTEKIETAQEPTAPVAAS